MNYQRIAVAIDFSDPSRHALREAGRIAETSGGNLWVHHVMDEHAATLFQKELKGDPALLQKALGDQVAEWIAAEVSESVTVEMHVSVGSPSRDVCKEAERVEADLLVLGTRGISHPSKRLGSLAGILVRQARMPVLLANPEASPIQSIVACIDYSPVSSEVMDHALTIASTEGLELQVIHNEPPTSDYYSNIALSSGLDPYGPMAIDPSVMQRIDENHARKLEKFVQEYQARAKPRRIQYCLTQHLADARGLLDYLKKQPNPLVVIGSHGRSGLRDALLGTTTERVLHGSPGNALVIRGQQA